MPQGDIWLDDPKLTVQIRTAVADLMAKRFPVAGPMTVRIMQNEHPATPAIRDSAHRMRVLADERGVDCAFLANQYAVWRSGAATTVVGTAKIKNLDSAIRAAETPLDAELEREFVTLRPTASEQQWISGLPENN